MTCTLAPPVLILFRRQTQKSCVWYLLIASVQKSLMGILFCVTHCKPGWGGGGEGGGYKLYMTAIPCCQPGWLLYKLWEHHFLVPDLQCSYFPLSPLVLTIFMQMIVCNLRKVKLSLLCPGKIGFFGPQSYCAGNIISWLYCYETMKHNCIHIHVWFIYYSFSTCSFLTAKRFSLPLIGWGIVSIQFT